MRVSDAAFFSRYLAGFDRSREALYRASESLADGKRVRDFGDDPAAAHAALILRGRAVRLEGFDRSARSARFDLQTIERSLSEAIDLVIEARTEAMAAASSVQTASNDVRAAAIDSLRQRLLGLGNVSQNGRYLFAGTATLTPPFDADGSYLGNDDETLAPVDSEQTEASTVSGRRAFMAPSNVFAILETLAGDLRSDNEAGIQAAIPALKDALDQFNDVRTEIGTRMQRIDAVLERHGDESTQILGRIAELEDADPARIVAELQAAQTSIDALSATAARVLGRSLFDYLG